MKISICIGTFNRADLLQRTLESVRASDFPKDQFEVIVVDNKSTDQTKEVAESCRDWFTQFIYLFEGRPGLSYARNTGGDAASGEFLCFIDDDTIISPEYLLVVYETFVRNNCDGVGARIIPDWTCPKPTSFAIDGPYNVASGILACFDPWDHERELSRPWFGAGMSMRRATFHEIGPFAEHLSRVGRKDGLGEDSEMYNRLRRAGKKLVYTPNAVVLHLVDPERLTMRAIRKWYFELGKFHATHDEQQYACFKGIPVWMFRKSMNHLLQIARPGVPHRRAFHTAKLWELLGGIRAKAISNRSRA